MATVFGEPEANPGRGPGDLVHADLEDLEKPRLWSISDAETHLIGRARQLDPESVHASARGRRGNYHGLLV